MAARASSASTTAASSSSERPSSSAAAAARAGARRRLGVGAVAAGWRGPRPRAAGRTPRSSGWSAGVVPTRLGDLADAQARGSRGRRCSRLGGRERRSGVAAWARAQERTRRRRHRRRGEHPQRRVHVWMNGSSWASVRPEARPEKILKRTSLGTAAVTIASTNAIDSTAPVFWSIIRAPAAMPRRCGGTVPIIAAVFGRVEHARADADDEQPQRALPVGGVGPRAWSSAPGRRRSRACPARRACASRGGRPRCRRAARRRACRARAARA